MLAVAHTEHWQIYLASLLLGIGVGFAFASMANLIVEAVRPDQTGVATGMNTVMRTIGGAVGGQVAAQRSSPPACSPTGCPEERGYTLSFAIMAAGARARRRRLARRPGPQRLAARTSSRGLEPRLSVE